MMTETEILAAARRLYDDHFSQRNIMLKERADERFNKTTVEIPEAYRKTTSQPKSNILDDEGRQIGTLVYAIPTPHLTPPTPQDQPATTKVEQFLIAMHQELEEANGPVWWQCTLAQVHENIGWIYFAPKKVAYKGQPKAVGDDADIEAQADYAIKNTQFKRDAGISAVFDYQYAVTGTVLHKGPVYNPHCVYIWKEVPASELKQKYGVQKSRDGAFEKVEAGAATGYAMDTGKAEATITVVEFWDKDECVIVAQESRSTWMGTREAKGGYELTRWAHNFGRVPYFARPAFNSEQLDADKMFTGPLDGLYMEIGRFKRILARLEAVSYQTAFSPLKITTKEGNEGIMDDNGQPLAFLELIPGKARQLAPGQDVAPVGQSPEVQNLYAELAECRQAIERYTLSPVSKGVSPGADTANAALSNLHRFQLSTLDPMAKEISRQGKAMYRFALEQIKKMQETVYVLNAEEDAYLSLSAEDIISVNVQAKAVPDQGQQQLLIEKHAAELKQLGLITLEEMYTMWGKENPEEHVLNLRAAQLFEGLWPVIQQQITTDLGMMDAINAMTQAQEQTGDARNAVPQLMQQAEQMNGMGSGSAGQPRTPGIRMAVEDVNTAGTEAQVGY